MHKQVNKPYITLNPETYISIRQQELRTSKRFGYKFYCEELCSKTQIQIQLQKHDIFQPNAETIK